LRLCERSRRRARRHHCRHDTQREHPRFDVGTAAPGCLGREATVPPAGTTTIATVVRWLDGRRRPSPHVRGPGLGRFLFEVGAVYSEI
jgi:hypothetical protein